MYLVSSTCAQMLTKYRLSYQLKTADAKAIIKDTKPHRPPMIIVPSVSSSSSFFAVERDRFVQAFSTLSVEQINEASTASLVRGARRYFCQKFHVSFEVVFPHLCWGIDSRHVCRVITRWQATFATCPAFRSHSMAFSNMGKIFGWTASVRFGGSR